MWNVFSSSLAALLSRRHFKYYIKRFIIKISNQIIILKYNQKTYD